MKSLNILNTLYFIFKINIIKINSYIVIASEFINKAKFLKSREDLKN